MNARVQYAPLFALIGVLLTGCAHTHALRECCSWREDQLAEYRKAALEAATSLEEWQRFRHMRLTTGSLELDTRDLKYVFYRDDERMDILIPTKQSVEDERTGGRTGTMLRVTLDPVTALIVSMKEEVE